MIAPAARPNECAPTRDERGETLDGQKQTQKQKQQPVSTTPAGVSNVGFLRTLHRGHPGQPWATGFKTDPHEATPQEWAGRQVRTTRDVPRGAVNAYVATATFPKGATRRLKESAAGVLAVVLDDIGTDDLGDLPLYSWTTESSPHNHQVGFALIPGEDIARVDTLLRAMTTAGYSVADRSGNSIARYVRLPNGINSKDTVIADVGAPFTTRLVEWWPERRFSVDEIAAAFDIDMATLSDRAVGGNSSPETDDELREAIASCATFHDPLVKLAARFVGRGMAQEDVVAVLVGLMDAAALNLTSAAKPDQRRGEWKARYNEIPRTVASAAEKFRDPRTRPGRTAGPCSEGGKAPAAAAVAPGQADGGEAGTPPPAPAPPSILILPSDHYTYVESARCIFGYIAPTKTLFTRGGAVVELIETETGPELDKLRAEGFQSRIDGFGPHVMVHVVAGHSLALKLKRCSAEDAKVLLASREASEILPKITVLAAAPVLIERDGKPIVLVKGHHPDRGGILVRHGGLHVTIPLAVAAAALEKLLRDFAFQSPGDKARALAMIVTPGLKLGGLFREPTPIDVAEADHSQAGKTYRQSLVRAVYGERAYPVAKKEGGVGSLDESVASGLWSGRSFIALDNLRGKLDSQYLEMAITMPEPVPVRIPFKGEALIDCRRVSFSITSNGVETTKDLANRSCIIRIRKQPRGYKWHQWDEGSLIEHIERQQRYYLACVHSVIGEWITRGKPRQANPDHDMREWAGALDWICQNLLGTGPLMEGHEAAQERVSNPGLTWLRAICLSVERACRLDSPLSASAIWSLGEEDEIVLPRGRVIDDEAAGRKFVGHVLAKIFREAGGSEVAVDEFLVAKTEIEEWDIANRTNRVARRYTFAKHAGGAAEASLPLVRGLRPVRPGQIIAREIGDFSESSSSRARTAQGADAVVQEVF